ncbi:MAG: NAD(P)H-dependent oxidoreductase [Pseudomonadota bacterium]
MNGLTRCRAARHAHPNPGAYDDRRFPMKAHIVLAHPEAGSFNGQLAATTAKTLGAGGWHTSLSDLYAMDFDAREGAHHYNFRKDPEVFHTQTEQRFNADQDTLPADVEAEVQHLLASDLLVVHFPLWWFGMPAILKGWMDRVFVYGRMYRSAVRYDAGVCAGKKMIACVTTGASAESCAHNGREGDTQLHLWPLLFPFRYLGYDVYEPEVCHGVGGVAFIEDKEDGLSAMDLYFRRWADTLDSLSARPCVPYNRDHEFNQAKQLVDDAPVHSPFVRHDPQAVPR